MKKYIAILLILSVFLLSACQKTPEKPPVVNKGDDGLMKTIKNNEEKGDGNETVIDNQYIVPDRWEDTFSVNDELVEVTIDSDIIFPDVSAFPVIEVEPDEFTIEHFNIFEGLYMPNCEYYDFFNPLPLTKSEIEELILQRKKSINDPNSDFNNAGLNEEEYQEALERDLAFIKELEKEYQTAPETVEEKPIIVSEELSANKYLFAKAKSLDSMNVIASIMMSCVDKRSNSILLTLSQGKSAQNEQHNSFYEPKPLTISEEQALQIAEQTALDIGLSGMEVNRIYIPASGPRDFYQVCLTKTYNGIPETYTIADQGLIDEASGQNIYTEPWFYERIIMAINDLGVKYIEWRSPSKETKILSENVQLLPFDKIKEIFKKQMGYQVAWQEENEYISQRKLYIDEVRLGMMRVNIKDAIDKYMMIPVWDFFGYTIDKYKEQQPGGAQLDENNEYTNILLGHSYLTINAIDGSIIDRELGY